MIRGPFTLSELRRKGTEDLSKFIDFIEKKNIVYWIDYGTLLGAIRQKSMLSWDGEFDISMWKKDIKRFSKLIPDLKELGFEVEYLRNEVECTNIKLINKSDSIGIIPIDIHFYDTDTINVFRRYGPVPKNKILDILVSCFSSNSLIKRFSIESNNRLYEDFKYDYHSFYKQLMQKYDINIIDKLVSKRKFYFVKGKYNNSEDYRLVFSDFVINGSFERLLNKKGFKNLVKIFIARLPYSFLNKLGLLFNVIFNGVKIKSKKQIKFNISIFRSFVKIPFDGIQVSSPKEFNSYLEMNYGKDWKTPKSSWSNDDRKELSAWTFCK